MTTTAGPWPPPGHVALCPVCNEPLTGWATDVDYVEHTEDLKPLWPDGPLIPVPRFIPRTEITGRTWTSYPCGHTAPMTADFTITSVRSPA